MSRLTPYDTLLVANRGEIALRIIRSARAHGFRTVAVYSRADAHARHVREADQALCIGAAEPAASYMNVDALIDAARRTGADAVHPGYGFLAENARFAAACRDAGLVFVGPAPEAIESMGDKAGAKRRMAAAGVPCIPGYDGADQGDARLTEEAARIGFPVMIKATAGGGGRGMRRVDRAEDFAAALQRARSEARSAFGDDTVILERAIVAPRHIEIQVLADRHGNVVHLGERDCSVQRRHQKLIEEAPSPAVDAALRARMGETAVAAVRAIGYEGAGTLEFLLDASGAFWFMEMNTRLQVEHPVTEAVTGIDIVALQLSIAAGEPLPILQQDVRIRGHAIEARLCAEDPANDFAPGAGRVLLWVPPQRLRVEHALASGTEVPPFYDSMIAKVVAHAPTRDGARRMLRRGLEDTVALGLPTNQDFLAGCLAHPAFADGGATTDFIDAHRTALLAHPPATDGWAAAALMLLETNREPGRRPAGRAIAHPQPIVLRIALDGALHKVRITPLGHHRYRAERDDARLEVALLELHGHGARIAVDGIERDLSWHRDGARLWLRWRGTTIEALDASQAPPQLRGDGGSAERTLRATMNGRVVAVSARVGDSVQAGQPLVTLEAMKMEHVHGAPAAGVVVAIHVAVGDQLTARAVLAEIAPA